MRTTTSPSQPIDLARESLQMGKDTGDKTFRLMALGMMLVTALATGVHALHSVWRDVRGRREGREYGRPYWQSYPALDEPSYNHPAREVGWGRREEGDPERSWSRREEARGKGREGISGWAESSRRQPNGRER